MFVAVVGIKVNEGRARFNDECPQRLQYCNDEDHDSVSFGGIDLDRYDSKTVVGAVGPVGCSAVLQQCTCEKHGTENKDIDGNCNLHLAVVGSR